MSYECLLSLGSYHDYHFSISAFKGKILFKWTILTN